MENILKSFYANHPNFKDEIFNKSQNLAKEFFETDLNFSHKDTIIPTNWKKLEWHIDVETEPLTQEEIDFLADIKSLIQEHDLYFDIELPTGRWLENISVDNVLYGENDLPIGGYLKALVSLPL